MVSRFEPGDSLGLRSGLGWKTIQGRDSLDGDHSLELASGGV